MSAPGGTTRTLRLGADRAEPLVALLAAPGPHVEAVLDVGRAPNGDLLVLLPEPAARLADVLAATGGLRAGEAVTVLVPLALALHDLHGAGVAHGGVGAAAVLLDADGSPAWAAPEAPSTAVGAGPSAFAAAVAADVAAFRSLGRALLDRSGAALPVAPDLPALAAALFDVAAPEPVRLHARPDAVPVLTPSRLLPAATAVGPSPEVPPLRVTALRERMHRALAGLRGVRVRVWAAVGVVAALLAVVPVLLPAEGAPRAGSGTTAPARAPGSSRAAPSDGIPTVAPTLAPPAALRALLAARNRCLAAEDERCLAAVDAAGSPVLAADRAAIRAGAAAVPADPAALRVRSTGGGVALADAGRATVLAVREPGGWRLRDVARPGP